MKFRELILCVDFDGTVVQHCYPDLGDDVPGAVESLKELAALQVRLILWTMRGGEPLADAVGWYAARDIPLFGINNNPQQHTWTNSPKAYAHCYIDDAALGCPLRPSARSGGRPVVDWDLVMQQLRKKFEE